MEWENFKLDIENAVGNKLDQLQSNLEIQKSRLLSSMSIVQSFSELLKQTTPIIQNKTQAKKQETNPKDYNFPISQSEIILMKAELAKTAPIDLKSLQKELNKKQLKKEPKPNPEEKNKQFEIANKRKIEEAKKRKEEDAKKKETQMKKIEEHKRKSDELKEKRKQEEIEKKKKLDEAKKKLEEDREKKRQEECEKKKNDEIEKKNKLEETKKKIDEAKERKKQEAIEKKLKAEEDKEKKKKEELEKKIKFEEEKENKRKEDFEKKAKIEEEKKRKVGEKKKKIEEFKKKEIFVKEEEEKRISLRQHPNKILSVSKSFLETKPSLDESSRKITSNPGPRVHFSPRGLSNTQDDIKDPLKNSEISKESSKEITKINTIIKEVTVKENIIKEDLNFNSPCPEEQKTYQLPPLEDIESQLHYLRSNYSEKELKTEKEFDLSVGAKSALSLLTTLDAEKFYLNRVPRKEVIWTFRIFFTFLNEDLPQDNEEAWRLCQVFLLDARDREKNYKTIDKYISEKISRFNFSDENLDKIEKIVFGKESFLQPQYYTDLCALTGLLMFSVKEAVFFGGAVRGKVPIWRQFKRLLHKQQQAKNMLLS